MPSLSGVAHVTLTVRHLRRSEAWYRDLFGFEVVRSEHGPHHDSVVMEQPGSALLLSLRQHHGAGTARFDETRTGLDRITWAVTERGELDAWAALLTERHVEHSAIAETPSGAVLVLRDPDHIQLELSWRRDAPDGATGADAVAERPAASEPAPVPDPTEPRPLQLPLIRS